MVRSHLLPAAPATAHWAGTTSHRRTRRYDFAQRVRASEALLRALVNQNDDLIRSVDSDQRVCRPDGTLIHVRERAELVPDGSGRPVKLVGTMQNITERKRAEEQPQLAGQVFESSGEAIVITDAQRRILSVNPAYTAINGYPREKGWGTRRRT